MAALELFESLTVTEIARWLDLHPFDVARVLGTADRLPASLRFEQDAVDAVRDLAQVETWWDDGEPVVRDEVRGRALVRSALKLLLDHGAGGDAPARADNLFRGLEPADQWLVRRAVNVLIRDGVLTSVPRASGLAIRVDGGQREVVRAIVDGQNVPESLEALWS